jgi:hypothetical protein
VTVTEWWLSDLPDYWKPKFKLPLSALSIISVHHVWKSRLESSGLPPAKFLSFLEPESFISWIQQKYRPADNTIFLFDFELLGNRENGLDLIERLGIASKSILVTSQFDEPKNVTRCKMLDVRLIPKSMASLIRIRKDGSIAAVDAILIDDDDMIALTWQIKANKAGKNLRFFFNLHDFFDKAELFSRDTPIFLILI